MILLITSSHRGRDCAKAIEAATEQSAEAVSTFHAAADCLRNREYSAVVIDECLLDADPEQGHIVTQHVETATAIYVNCAISSLERIVREVNAGLRRRAQEQEVARKAEILRLRGELREVLTGLMLNCELALETENLPPSAEGRIHAADTLAHTLAAALEVEPIVSGRT
jgi:hypothetical protein